MIDIIKSYFNDKKFYVIHTDQEIYIKNYEKIISIKEDELIIYINDKMYKFNGNSFILKKSVDKDLVLSGNIESIKII